MSNNYILPSEFLLLVLFWFGLPLLLAFAPLTWLFILRGLHRNNPARMFAAYLIIALTSILVGLGIFIWSPPFLKFLAVRDVLLWGQYWMILPLSFVVVAMVSPVAGWWALRALRPNLSVKRDAPTTARPLP
jgi:hypothetical protein